MGYSKKRKIIEAELPLKALSASTMGDKAHKGHPGNTIELWFPFRWHRAGNHAWYTEYRTANGLYQNSRADSLRILSVCG